jgi:hypothetical protein
VDLFGGLSGSGEGIKMERVTSDHRSNERPRRRANEHVCVVRLPSRGHAEGKEGAEIEGCAGDSASTQDKSN